MTSKDRIRVPVEVFRKIVREQERIRKIAVSSQVVSVVALGVAVGAMILAWSL